MSVKIRSIKFNFVMNLLLTGSSLLFPLITFPLVTRALYADMYGLCNWAMSVVNWFSLIGMLGVTKYGIRTVARNRDDKQLLNKVTKEILFVTIISTLISFLVFLALVLFVDPFRSNKVLLLINGLTIICNTLGVTWFFQGIEQYAYITIRGIVIKIISLLGVIALVHVPDDYLVYAMLIVVANGAANLINFFYMMHLIDAGKHVSGSLKSLGSMFGGLAQIARGAFKHVKPLMVFFTITAAISIYGILDTVMLGILSTTREVGYYTAAGYVKTALAGIVSALTGVLLPRAAHMLSHGQRQDYLVIIKKCIFVALMISFGLSVVMTLAATPLIAWYAGPDFKDAGPVITLAVYSLIPASLSTICCDAILVPMGKEKICSIVYCVAAAVDFSLNLVLIPSLGAQGAALSTLMVEILVLVIEGSYILKMKLLKSEQL
ncbi:MAG: flippase [Eggerthellaceae bacterium]